MIVVIGAKSASNFGKALSFAKGRPHQQTHHRIQPINFINKFGIEKGIKLIDKIKELLKQKNINIRIRIRIKILWLRRFIRIKLRTINRYNSLRNFILKMYILFIIKD